MNTIRTLPQSNKKNRSNGDKIDTRGQYLAICEKIKHIGKNVTL